MNDPVASAGLATCCWMSTTDQQVKVKVEEGSESVILPCKTPPDLPEDTRVVWTRYDPELMVVHVYSNSSNNPENQHCHYFERTKMNDLLRTGDLSLTLKQPTQRDTGGYICTIYRDKDILRQKVVLQVKEQFPSWAIALLVLLVLFLVVFGGLLFNFRQYFMSVYKVEVDSGVESVQLPCKTRVRLLKDAKVEWKDRKNRKVHVYQSGSDQPEEQDQEYKGRTKMKRKLLKPGDFSLTLKHPSSWDRNVYTCTVYNKDGKILMKKQVLLHVRVLPVKVDSGVESFQLPFKSTVLLPEDAKVEWKNNSYRTVHVSQNYHDQPEEQDQSYKDRTAVNNGLLRTGDLSLTLKHPVNTDRDTYTCTVYSGRGGNILMRKQVALNVKVPQVEVESGAESIKLPFTTTISLPEGAKMEWTNVHRMVHIYPDAADQAGQQDKHYSDRTEIDDDCLTLKYPTDNDDGTYTCTVYSREGNILLKKQVELKVKVCQVEVEEGAESVQLPFQTTENLPEGTKVEWWRKDPKPSKKVHVYQEGPEEHEEQHQDYTNRTKMNEDPLTTGDLRLTLDQPKEGDSGEYSCKVSSSEENIWLAYRYKTVVLTVKGRAQVQDQTEEAPFIQLQSV
ncbi:uncharacterized protein LOC115775770 [Archocentrus centrarchus]|uniref:uncharacterized protein LOC115775770 n=1 Tax=Archocentrus centrarchus TaxID=63155 RepID=UPI0011E9BAB3|nr:uncharacterized protein LOC115775770 [Archocentrus centrarchus]